MEQEEINDFADAAKQKEKKTKKKKSRKMKTRKKKPRKKKARKVIFLCTFCVFKLFDWFLDWHYLSKTNIS